MRTIGFSLMVGSALFFTLGTLQPGHAMSFGKHNNGSGHANQSITQGNSNGNGNGNGNGNRNRNGNTYEASFDALPYQVPVPEPSTVVLFASGVLGLGLWRWKKQS
jgi:hypothetical protein